MIDTTPRKSGKSVQLSQSEFKQRFRSQFYDPRFGELSPEIDKITEVAWKNYDEGRKSPLTQAAGKDYADPDFQLSKEWLDTKDAINEAQKFYENNHNSRILIVTASDRNENTCPGERSKTSRLCDLVEETILKTGLEVEILDLSRTTAEYGKTIHPCKGCVSTAMPLCHWPCSCYPNHSLGQTQDWMNEIYPMFVRARGIMFITPVYWHQAPAALKLLIDRLVCADGGNPDPTTTKGKTPELAKKLELQDWPYPKHLEGRYFSVVVHGDATGVDSLRNNLCDWLEEISLIPCSSLGTIGRYVGYYGPYATSHAELDKDEAFQMEVRNAATSLAQTVQAKRNIKTDCYLPDLEEPRKK